MRVASSVDEDALIEEHRNMGPVLGRSTKQCRLGDTYGFSIPEERHIVGMLMRISNDERTLAKAAQNFRLSQDGSVMFPERQVEQ